MVNAGFRADFRAGNTRERCRTRACVQNSAMPYHLSYTTITLRRDNMSRRPEDWVVERARKNIKAVAVNGQHNLILEGDPPQAAIFEGDDARALIDIGHQAVLLGTEGETPVFAVALDDGSAASAASMAPGTAAFMDLRQVGPLIADADGHVLAHARGMIYWHSRHGFCGVCGSPTQSRYHGHERVCLNPDCGVSHFPRTDPAVIMLVSRDDIPGGACLLGSHARWSFGMYSTLAGFVEPGETLEQCVAREVFEESAIQTTDITYMASQPWPFPSSLMLGFRARAISYDIKCDPTELKDAQWFSREQVLEMKEFADAKGDDTRLPRKDSISRWLIQSWLDDVK